MEAYMKRRCIDTAVYWGSPVPDEYGQSSFAAPVEIKCFWQEEEALVRTVDGRESISNASVFVLQDLDESGMLYHGVLLDLDAGQQADPKTVSKAYEIKRFIKLPSINLEGNYVRKANVGWLRT